MLVFQMPTVSAVGGEIQNVFAGQPNVDRHWGIVESARTVAGISWPAGEFAQQQSGSLGSIDRGASTRRRHSPTPPACHRRGRYESRIAATSNTLARRFPNNILLKTVLSRADFWALSAFGGFDRG